MWTLKQREGWVFFHFEEESYLWLCSVNAGKDPRSSCTQSPFWPLVPRTSVSTAVGKASRRASCPAWPLTAPLIRGGNLLTPQRQNPRPLPSELGLHLPRAPRWAQVSISPTRGPYRFVCVSAVTPSLCQELSFNTHTHAHTHTQVSWSEHGLEEEFPDTKYFRKVSLLQTKRAELVRGAANTAGWLPDGPGRADPRCGLVANFYSFKTKKIPAGRVALGDWSGCDKVTTWWLFWSRGRGWGVPFRSGEPMATGAMGAPLVPGFLSCVLDVACPWCRAPQQTGFEKKYKASFLHLRVIPKSLECFMDLISRIPQAPRESEHPHMLLFPLCSLGERTT